MNKPPLKIEVPYKYDQPYNPPKEMDDKGVLRIRDDYLGSPIRIFSIPDPHKRIQVFWVVHPGCGFWIRILTFYPSRISYPGVKKAPDPGSGSATLRQS
jgi:hypothetical protein